MKKEGGKEKEKRQKERQKQERKENICYLQDAINASLGQRRHLHCSRVRLSE